LDVVVFYLDVEEGKIISLIGANGAGKSTTLRSIMGLVKPKHGSISYLGKNLLELKTQEMVNHGIALVPEGRRIFPNLTVLENLKIGAYCRNDKKGIDEDMEWVFTLFSRLKERTWQLEGRLCQGPSS